MLVHTHARCEVLGPEKQTNKQNQKGGNVTDTDGTLRLDFSISSHRQGVH